MKKVCVLCEHWRFDSGDPAFSELTPGTEWSSWCTKSHWSVDGKDVYTGEYKDFLLKAEKCEDYEEDC